MTTEDVKVLPLDPWPSWSMTSAPPRAIVNADGPVAKVSPPLGLNLRQRRKGRGRVWPLPSERTEAAGLLRPASLSSLPRTRRLPRSSSPVRSLAIAPPP